MIYIRILIYTIGLIIFSYGIATVINVQHLGIHPWEVLGVALNNLFGLTIGTWSIIIGFVLIGVALILDRSYIKVGTFTNAIIVGLFVDFYLMFEATIPTTYTSMDILTMVIGIIIMGVGGGIYNSAQIGSGPRDGFMLSISDKTGWSIGRVRIMIETIVLIIGWLIGGPVFIFTFIFTFVQSPIFQFTYLRCLKWVDVIDERVTGEKKIRKML